MTRGIKGTADLQHSFSYNAGVQKQGISAPSPGPLAVLFFLAQRLVLDIVSSRTAGMQLLVYIFYIYIITLASSTA